MRRILLLEAGSVYSPNLYPPNLANADIVGGPEAEPHDLDAIKIGRGTICPAH